MGAVALLLVSGCAPEPEPVPTASVSPTPSSTPTLTADPAAEPTPAFDVTCEDVAAELTTLVGAPAGAVDETLSLVSSPNWYPGPAIHAFQRAGGVACSPGDSERSGEVTILPGAQTVTEGAASLGGAGAFERIEDGTAVEIEGADAALTGIDEFERPILDIRVGPDRIRLTTYEGSGISDLAPVAEQIVQNLTVGRPAPQ